MTFEPKDSKKLRGLAPEKLAAELKAAQVALYAATQKLAAGELKDTASVRPMRRYVARVKTLANENQ